jgi:hypothetical protein
MVSTPSKYVIAGLSGARDTEPSNMSSMVG